MKDGKEIGDYSVNDKLEKEEAQKILDWIREVFNCYEWGEENKKKDQVIQILEGLGFERLFYCLIFWVSCMMAKKENVGAAMVKHSLVEYLLRSDSIESNVTRILSDLNLGRLAVLADIDGLRMDVLVEDQIRSLPREQKDAVTFVATYIVFLSQESEKRYQVLLRKGVDFFTSRTSDIFMATVKRRLVQKNQ